MVGKNNELNKSRHIFEHINRYSIRKFKVGVASVAIAGCFVLPMGTNTVSATEVKTEETVNKQENKKSATDNNDKETKHSVILQLNLFTKHLIIRILRKKIIKL